MNNDRSKIKYREIVKLFSDCRIKQIGLFFLCAIAVSSELYLVYQIRGLIDCLSAQNYDLFIILIRRVFLTAIFAFVFTILQTKQWHTFRAELINKMRVKMYKKMLVQLSSYFDSKPSGDITSAILNDGSMIADSAGVNILMLLLNLLRLLIIFVIMYQTNVIVATIVLIVSLFYFITCILVNGIMRQAFAKERQSFANLTQSLLEVVKAISIVKVLNKYDFFNERFKTQVWRKYFPNQKRIIEIEVRASALNSLMHIILPILVICSGVVISFHHGSEVGSIVMMYTLVGQLIEPLNNLSDFYQGRQKALGAAERVYDYLFSNVDDSSDRNSSLSDIQSLDINIEKYYWKNKVIFSDFKQSAIPGAKIHLQGPSGSGKTTLLKLLANLYSVDFGFIKYNGEDVQHFDKDSIYRKVSIVFQEPFIFEGSLYDNLTLGDNFQEGLIYDVLKITCLDQFVKEHGLNYYLNENGANISGGQRQRVCLARVLLRKPQVLLLDEATSALDHETEEQLLQRLNIYIKQNNIILIAVSHGTAIREICNENWFLS